MQGSVAVVGWRMVTVDACVTRVGDLRADERVVEDSLIFEKGSIKCE